MKQDKFCVSRTLIYLVLLLVLVVGFFWGVNYLNQQNNLVSKPKAVETHLKESEQKAVDALNSKAKKEIHYTQQIIRQVENKTCKKQGGDWYRTSSWSSCKDLGSNFTQITNPSDSQYWDGYICCKQNK